jgi:hypothetical protein
MRAWTGQAVGDRAQVRREFAKRAVVRPVVERWLGVDWYPATFVCENVRICREANGTVRCRPSAKMLRVRAERWRLIGFRLLWAWRYGRQWDEQSLSPTTPPQRGA